MTAAEKAAVQQAVEALQKVKAELEHPLSCKVFDPEDGRHSHIWAIESEELQDPVANALTAIRSLGDGWQSIATAPKDGTGILVWNEPLRIIEIAWDGKSIAHTLWCELPAPPAADGKEG